MLPLVRKIADSTARAWNCPAFGFDELLSIGSEALVDAAERWKPAEQYNDAGHAEAHFWAYAKPRVLGAMIDARRQAKLERLAAVPEDEELACDSPAEDGQAETIDLIAAIYNRFGPQSLELVNDYVFNGLRQSQIADKLGISQSGVSLRWQKLAAKLRRWLKKEE